MGIFRQLGDPVCPPCLCQHHGAAYMQAKGLIAQTPLNPYKSDELNGATIIQQAITITQRCCICCNAAIVVGHEYENDIFQIERPLATTRTTQRSYRTNVNVELHHVAAWEVLDPGMYTYYVVNRSGATQPILNMWLKIIASDCEG